MEAFGQVQIKQTFQRRTINEKRHKARDKGHTVSLLQLGFLVVLIEIEDLGTNGVLIIDGQGLAIAMASVVSFIYLSFSYRAMHTVLTRYCYRRSSVGPSICLSVHL